MRNDNNYIGVLLEKFMRRFPGAVCQSHNRRYLAVYSFQHDVLVLPNPDMHGLERIAHVSYSMGNRKGGIDYFQLTEDRNSEEVIRVNKTIKKDGKRLIISPVKMEGRSRRFKRSLEIESDVGEIQYELDGKEIFIPKSEPGNDISLSRARLRSVNQRYDMQYEFVKLPPAIEQEVLDFARADVLAFCGDKIAKNNRGMKKETVDKISAKTKMERINPWKYLRGGKQWFIPQCLLEANIDFGQGCISGFVPVDNSWSFDGEYFHNLFSMPSGECDYCYAERQHRSFSKTLFKFDAQQIKKELLGDARLSFEEPDKPLGRPVKILRFGKRVESWTPFTQEEFIKTLEICAETGTRGIIPTKFLPYSPETTKLLKKTKSSVLYSIGFDEVEHGACMWGANNRFRLEQALKYRQAGVNSNIYLLTIGHLPPSQREMDVLEFADYGKRIPIQLLPVRFKGRELIKKLTEDRWDNLISKQKSFEEQPYGGSYTKERQSILLKDFDPFWLNLVKNSNGRIRICHHNDEHVYCGGCFQRESLQCRNGNKK